ncbi:MAG: hypothetical protein AB7R69_04275 [Candidatus Babeliales bacterium]
MKKLALILGLSTTLTTLTASIPAWKEAQKDILTYAKKMASYDAKTCMWTTKAAELVLSSDYEPHCWNICTTFIEKVLPQLPIYKAVCAQPHDDILWHELELQTMIYAAEITTKTDGSFELCSKVNNILRLYILVLKKHMQTA